ncbi:MAG: hypothetical protein ACR2RE_27080 [Geminicoccaceae bacterium]
MTRMLKNASLALLSASTLIAASNSGMAIDMDKAHQTAIQNCVNWNGLSSEYCACVQDKVRSDLTNESYSAMLEFAQAYDENRRADLAAMQVNTELSKALEPVDAVIDAAESACKS